MEAILNVSGQACAGLTNVDATARYDPVMRRIFIEASDHTGKRLIVLSVDAATAPELINNLMAARAESKRDAVVPGANLMTEGVAVVEQEVTEADMVRIRRR